MTGLETAIAIREPRETELTLCRMLLPEACVNPVARHFRLTFAGERSKLVGALSYRDDAIVLGGIRVHVIPTQRRKGIGARMMEYVANEAKKLGRGGLLADADLKSEPDAEPFLTSQGFRKQGTVTFAEIELADLRERMKGSAGKFADSNRKLPEGEGARFVNLGEAGADEVTRLYANHIAHMEPLIGLREAFRIDEQVDSVVLLIGDRVVGFVLARVQEGTLHVPAWVVSPEYRER
jgi:GNAT superfamily N-acetyltransferase